MSEGVPMIVMSADDNAALPAVGWCEDCRMDPITGLVAFPDFHERFPAHLGLALNTGLLVGLAIGDVDNLKEYVESTNVVGRSTFGHMAGYGVMSQLGAIARSWFWAQTMELGCLATFGGDEIIIAIATSDPQWFLLVMSDLQQMLNQALPRTVSFSTTILDASAATMCSNDAEELYLQTMYLVDRELFRFKAARRRGNLPPESFLTRTNVVGTLPMAEVTP